MNFKDISRPHIEHFLKLNNIITTDFYNEAIQLINSDIDFQMTKPIENWLIAFEHFNERSKVTDISPYYESDEQDVIDNLNFMHCYNFDQLPEDIITEILCYSDIKTFKLISLGIYNHCKKIMSNNWFRKRKCELMLLRKGYNDPNLFNIDYIYRALVPQAGNVVYFNKEPAESGSSIPSNINFYEPIVKVIQIKHIILVLTQSGKLFVKAIDDTYSVTNLNIFIDDILFYNNTYYYLSGGKIYYGFFNIINRFSYEGRSQANNELKLKRLTSDHVEMDNIISICACDNGLIFLKTNGQVYDEHGHFVVDHALQIASNKKHYYILLNTYQLYDNVVDCKIKKLVSGYYSCLVIGETNHSINKDGVILPLSHIKTGIYNKFQGVFIINDGIEIHKHDKIETLPINAINVFNGHYDYDYYLIVND